MLNFKKVYIDPEIYYVENFISQEEIDIILGSTFEWIQTNEDGNGAGAFEEKDLETLKTEGVARRFTGVIKSEEKFWWEVIVKKLRQLLDNENEKYNAVPYITKYLPEGDWGLYYHYENHPDCGPIGKYTTKGFTLGLNDGWSGGEISFKHKDIEFTVKPGTIVVFPASEDYTHAVLKSRDGDRIVHSAFVYSNDFYESDVCHEAFPLDTYNPKNKNIIKEE
jgi:hypothetical protein